MSQDAYGKSAAQAATDGLGFGIARFPPIFLFRDECKHNILFTDSAHPCHFDSGNDHAHNIVLDHTQSKYTIKCQQSLANIIHHSISIHACMYTVYHFFDNYLCR